MNTMHAMHAAHFKITGNNNSTGDNNPTVFTLLRDINTSAKWDALCDPIFEQPQLRRHNDSRLTRQYHSDDNVWSKNSLRVLRPERSLDRALSNKETCQDVTISDVTMRSVPSPSNEQILGIVTTHSSFNVPFFTKCNACNACTTFLQ